MWQPIETAPQNGDHIIIAVTGGPHGSTVCEAYWHPGDDRFDADWWLGATTPADYTAAPISDIMHGRVSHWMPLPGPPKLTVVSYKTTITPTDRELLIELFDIPGSNAKALMHGEYDGKPDIVTKLSTIARFRERAEQGRVG